MRYAIFSDVHSNLEAFQSVLQEIEKKYIGRQLFLGDIIGYGANPNESVNILKGVADIIVAGNHDFAAVDMTDINYFNPYAREAVLWTKNILMPEYRDFIKTLKINTVVDNMTLAHSSPKEPEKWHYILNILDAMDNLKYFDTTLCFIGHSHIPFVIEKSAGGKINILKDKIISIKDTSKYIINAGSVGQPRDGNPDASFAIYDSANATVEFMRVPYDILSCQEKMKREGLPDYLINRLTYGR